MQLIDRSSSDGCRPTTGTAALAPSDDSPPPAVPKVQLVSASLLVVSPWSPSSLAIVIFWNHGIGWLDLGLAVGMYLVTGVGLSVGFHRLFSHRSFVPARWLKVTLAIAGTMGIEGSVTSWVSQHRRHHAFTDRPGDPHSPRPEGPGSATNSVASGTPMPAGCSCTTRSTPSAGAPISRGIATWPS